jgi:hypothetical protein
MLAGSFLLCFGAGIADSQVHALTAEIKLAQSVVKNNEDFSVTTTIRNTGAAEETLVVWDCSYPSQWRPDSSIVKGEVIPCRQNVPGMVKLRPGETYTRPVLVHVELKTPEPGQSVTFRLGYGTWAYYGTIEPAPKSPAIWSNPVTVTVISD